MTGNTFRTLEFETIRALLLTQSGSAAGRTRLEALRPLTDPEAVRKALATTSEGVRLLEVVGRQPYHDLPDVEQILAEARVEGAHLEPRALMDVASFIEGGLEIARRVTRADGAPGLARLASEVRAATDIAASIHKAVLPSGDLADEASPQLAEIRRSLARFRVQLRSVMESVLRGKEADRILQDKVITTRNDRFVLLLKAEHRGQLPGIIHGSSGSGASLLVEPMQAVELNNDIVALGDEERREVVRILREVTARVGERAEDLARAAQILGELDAVQAMALLAREMDAHPPDIPSDLHLDLRDARHPLLMPRLCERLGIPRRSSREPVPVTIRAGPGELVLVISGPNTGGKTVALKTVGLLALMAQCGLHVPAEEGSRLPVFRRIYADIGDDQSIAADLSTFSAHLAAIVEMTRDLALPALVLLDEVGAGTDPTEGGALGVAILDYFRRRGALTVATTHHGLMKAYAQSTQGVACGSFGYDPETYEPTYQLSLGAPGRSLALEMAERLGLPAEVVADARARRDAKEAQAEALLKRLEEKQASLRREAETLAEDRRVLEAAIGRQEAAEREILAKKRADVEVLVRDLRRRSEEAARTAADAIRDAVARVELTRRTGTAERARTKVIAAVHAAHEEVLRDAALELPPEQGIPRGDIAVGSRVRIRNLGIAGSVLGLLERGEVEVAVAGKRLRVPRGELTFLDAGPARPIAGAGQPSVFEGVKTGGEVAEINLVGLTVDEALPKVDKLLDHATLADGKQIRLIHGFGQGRLRKAVAGLLEGHPHVAGFRTGGPGEGGGGVTVVELKD